MKEKKRLLLLSNSTNYGEGYLEYPKKNIKHFLGNQVSKVVFIPYAGVGFSYDVYTQKVATSFADIGYEVLGIHQFADAKNAIMGAEAIAVGGGNTFELLNQLYRNDLIEAIRERVISGVPYMGWSAGSNVAGPSIKTTNDMPIVEPESFDALNLIPFQINPHYTEEQLPNHGGETRKDRINEFIAINQADTVIGIPEGNLLEITDNACKLVGNGIVKSFRYGSDVEEFSSDDNLDFLLK